MEKVEEGEDFLVQAIDKDADDASETEGGRDNHNAGPDMDGKHKKHVFADEPARATARRRDPRNEDAAKHFIPYEVLRSMDWRDYDPATDVDEGHKEWAKQSGHLKRHQRLTTHNMYHHWDLTKAFDRDLDGFITKEEMVKWFHDYHGVYLKHILDLSRHGDLDLNGDGELDEDEIEHIHIKIQREGHDMPGIEAFTVLRFDKDHNFKLDKTEYQALLDDESTLKQALTQTRDRIIQNLIDHFDTNKDGRLTKKEFVDDAPNPASLCSLVKEKMLGITTYDIEYSICMYPYVSKKLWTELDENENGMLDVAELENVYDDHFHPISHHQRMARDHTEQLFAYHDPDETGVVHLHQNLRGDSWENEHGARRHDHMHFLAGAKMFKHPFYTVSVNHFKENEGAGLHDEWAANFDKDMEAQWEQESVFSVD